jgi:hypothetical protein
MIEGGNWTCLGQTWLVHRQGERISACIAYHPGRPFARLDFLCLQADLPDLSKVRVVRDILEAALAVCALHGSSFVTGVVPYDLPEYGQFLEKRGGKHVNEGWIFMAPLADALERRNKIDGRRKNNANDNGHADA